ncbi:MAG: response regulator transcription factor [Dehalococcoidia bacterium]|nr:response regulator transcription factor [Dehalococcoidia bacterium]
MKQIQVFIVDDNFVARRGLCSTLSAQVGITIAGESSTGTEALRTIKQIGADVVLMDIRMSGMDGIKTTSELKRLMPEIQILVLTVVDDPIVLAHALNAGAAGYLVYGHFTPESLVTAVMATGAGASICTPPLEELFPGTTIDQWSGIAVAHQLTAREDEIWKMIATGCDNREIARTLNIEEKTVKNHINNIYSKLGIASRQQAVLLALNTRDSGSRS